MGILDDAIREHLDLKRRHGARDAELREIEDEAFGQGEQPDPFVAGELYTEVGSSETSGSEAAPSEIADVGNEEPTRLVEPEALRPSEPPSAPEPETSDETIGSEPASQIPGQVELPDQDQVPGQEQLGAGPEARPAADEPESYRPAEDPAEPPSEEMPEPPSEEMPEPPPTSESLEELIAEEEPFPEDSAAPPAPAPAETERESRPLEPEPAAEAPPELEPSVPDPPPPPPEPGAEPPGRARGRVDVPTQEHPPPGETGDLPPLPGDEPELGRPDTSYELPPHPLEEPSSTDEPASTEHPAAPEEPISDEEPLPDEQSASGSDGPQLYDFETDEDSVPPPSGRSAVDDDFEALGPAEEEAPYLDEEEPYPEEESTAVRPAVEDEEDEDSSGERRRRFERDEGEEGLWFEKGPPKDFDFDD